MAGAKVIDADGHIIERTDELRKYLKSPFNKRGGPLTASEPWDRELQQTLPPEPRTFPSAPTAQDWLRLLDDHNIEQAFLYPTALGNVSGIREPEYAVALCQSYNDYVHDRYAKISNRLRPVAILPFQDPESAVIELRRAISAVVARWCAQPGCACRWGIIFMIRFIGRRKLWAVLSLCMAPTAPKNWPR